MNDKEQKRAMVLTTVTDGRVTVRQAGEVLGLSARRLTTRYGTVEKVRVPRPTGGRMEFTELSRYRRRRWDVGMRPSGGSSWKG